MLNSNINLQTQSSNALHGAIMEEGSKDRPSMLAPERYMENYNNVSQDIRDQLNAEAEAIQIILTGIDNDIYSTVNACPNACEMWNKVPFCFSMNHTNVFQASVVYCHHPREVLLSIDTRDTHWST
ncbi:hypothetical protein Tco_1539673 [Tanacetum coccineum]